MGDRFRQRIRAERERRSWAQADLTRRLTSCGIDCSESTVSKIENGTRAVRIEEIDAFATIFGISTDVLIGRSGRNADLAWALSKLTSNAQKIAGDVSGLRRRISGDLEDAAAVGSLDAGLIQRTAEVVTLMTSVEELLTRLSNQFPIPQT